MAEGNAYPTRKSHRLPAESYAQAKQAYFFTLCARQHGEPFRKERLAELVIRSLLWTRERHRWALYAYCLMPDHLHFLCRPLEPSSKLIEAGARGCLPEGVLEHVARFKSYTTQQAWALGIVGQLWQRSSYDILTDDSRPSEEIGRYILENPVRKGFVASWGDWPYSGMPDPW